MTHFKLIAIVCFLSASDAHVSLTYPEARYLPLDYLDNFRTAPPCGMPKTSNGSVTTFEPGQTLNISWHMGYSHRGGFRVQLLNSADQIIATLTPGSSQNDYIGQEDETQQKTEITLPDTECNQCAIRLQRQALEWGPSYVFHTCADVNIVENGGIKCSSNGFLRDGKCQCNRLYHGDACQFKDDCVNVGDCSNNGRCLKVSSTSYPRLVCFCLAGFFGRNCLSTSPVTLSNFKEENYQKRVLRDTIGAVMYWRVVEVQSKIEIFGVRTTDKNQLEVVLEYKGDSWISVGWRPKAITSTCRDFPIELEEVVGTAEGEAEPVSEGEVGGNATNAEPEGETVLKAHSESESEPGLQVAHSEAEPHAESKAPTAESGVEPTPAWRNWWMQQINSSDPWKNIHQQPKAEPDTKHEPSSGSTAEPEAEPETFAEGHSKSKTDAGPKTKTEAVVKPEAEAEPAIGALAEPKSEPESKSEVESSSESGSKSEPETKSEAESKAGSKSSSKSSDKSKSSSEIGSQSSESKSEPEPEGGSSSSSSEEGDLHAMDCTDVVIGMAKGNFGRVYDAYTRDRSTPLRDDIYGGCDSLTAAAAVEVDGVTRVLFRKPLQADSQSDHSIDDALLEVIWAAGLRPTKAPMASFYEADAFKYHGHQNRGHFTINLLEQPVTPAPVDPNCDGYFAHENSYKISWKVNPKGVSVTFIIEATMSTDQWSGVGFSKHGGMAGMDVILVSVVGTDSKVVIEDRHGLASVYVAPAKDDRQSLTNITSAYSNGKMTAQFTRLLLTGDADDYNLNECVKLIYPLKPGSARLFGEDKIGIDYHRTTPVASPISYCFGQCMNANQLSPEAEAMPVPQSEPAPTQISFSEPTSLSHHNTSSHDMASLNVSDMTSLIMNGMISVSANMSSMTSYNTSDMEPPYTSRSRSPNMSDHHASSNMSGQTSSNMSGHASSNMSGQASSNMSTHASSNMSTHASSNMSTHASSNMSDHTSSNMSRHVSSNMSDHTSTNMSGDTSSNMSGYTSSSMSDNASSNKSDKTSSNMSGYTSSSMSDNASSNKSDKTSSNMGGHASSNISAHASSNMSDHTSSNMSGDTSSNMSGYTSSSMNDNASSNVSDKTSSNMGGHASSNMIAHASANMSDHASSNMSTRTPSNMSGHASLNMSDHTSSNMSDHASSNMSGHASSNMSGHLSSNMSSHTSSNMSGYTSSNMNDHAALYKSGKTSSNVSDHSSSNMSGHTSSNMSDTISANMNDAASLNMSGNTSSNIRWHTSSNISGHTSSNMHGHDSSNMSSRTSSNMSSHKSSNISGRASPNMNNMVPSNTSDITSSNSDESMTSSKSDMMSLNMTDMMSSSANEIMVLDTNVTRITHRAETSVGTFTFTSHDLTSSTGFTTTPRQFIHSITSASPSGKRDTSYAADREDGNTSFLEEAMVVADTSSDTNTPSPTSHQFTRSTARITTPDQLTLSTSTVVLKQRDTGPAVTEEGSSKEEKVMKANKKQASARYNQRSGGELAHTITLGLVVAAILLELIK